MSEPLPQAGITPPTIPMVTRFEAVTIRIARYIFGQFPRELVVRLIHEKIERPECLNHEAIDLLKDTFAKGSVLFLVRNGGWRRDRFLDKRGKPTFGRLWERSPLERLTLKFGPAVLDFLMWLTASPPKDEKNFWNWQQEPLTVADQFFFMLAYDACRAIDTAITGVFQQSPVFSGNPFCLLLWAEDFENPSSLDFSPLFKEPDVFLIEALQPFFESRWLNIERNKGQINDWNRMHREGGAQYAILQAYLQAAGKAQRWDLGRFVLATLSRLLSQGEPDLSFWIGGLQGSAPARLSRRIETQRNALALLRQYEIFRHWEQQARRSGFMDEDYELAKFFLAEWERYQGNMIIPRAESLVRQIEPLRSEN